jgi:hypothetical protein
LRDGRGWGGAYHLPIRAPISLFLPIGKYRIEWREKETTENKYQNKKERTFFWLLLTVNSKFYVITSYRVKIVVGGDRQRIQKEVNSVLVNVVR